MMKKGIIGALLPLALSGCAPDYLAAGLPMLEGKPITQAVHYLGYPTEEKKILGKTMYSWVNYQSGSFSVPDEDFYPSISHGHPGVAFPRSYMPYREEFYYWSCRLDIVTDNDVIFYSQYNGNGGGCRYFGDRLKPLVLAVTGQTKKPLE